MISNAGKSAVVLALAVATTARAELDLRPKAMRAIAPAREPSPEEIDAAIARRRFQLTVHQAVGFATEGVGLAALALSIADDHDRFGSGGRTGSLKTWELALSFSTEALTGINFLLGATAPQPFEKKGGVDTTLVHKILMFTAAGLQLAKIVLSALLFSAADAQGVEAMVALHRVALYGAPAAFLAGSLIQVF